MYTEINSVPVSYCLSCMSLFSASPTSPVKKTRYRCTNCSRMQIVVSGSLYASLAVYLSSILLHTSAVIVLKQLEKNKVFVLTCLRGYHFLRNGGGGGHEKAGGVTEFFKIKKKIKKLLGGYKF